MAARYRCNALTFVLQSTGDLPVTVFFSTVHVYFLVMLPHAAVFRGTNCYIM